MSDGTSTKAPEVALREVRPDDLPLFFEYQRDPVAVAMAAFPSREREAFDAHWARILADPAVIVRTVSADGEVAGNVLSFDRAGAREVGYVLGRAHWGRGIATRALALYLEVERTRPLVARVVKHNGASLRVLAKTGFRVVGECGWPPEDPAAALEDFVLQLD